MNGEIWKCGDLYNYAKPYLEDYKGLAACAYNTNAAAISIITGLSSPSTSDFQETILQSALISELQNAKTSLGTGISGIKYSLGRSKAEFVQSKLAEVPTLQTTLRVLLYAMFPFTFVIILFPGGLGVLTEYMKAIIWIELWTPTAAILNMFMIQYAQDKMASEYSENGLTVINAIDYLGNGSAIAGVAGYLYASVPALTWLFLTGSESMLSNFGSEEVSKTNAVRAKTGEEISLAETQHFEAIKNGTVSGAVLGTEMNLGVDTLADKDSFEKVKDAQKYVSLSQVTEISDSETLGKVAGASSSFEEAASINGKLKVGAINESGIVGKKGLGYIKQNANQVTGEINAANEIPLSIDEFTSASKQEIKETLQSGQEFEIRKKYDEKSLHRKLSASEAAHRGATADATAAVHSKESQQAELMLAGILGYGANANGSQPVNYSNYLNFTNGIGHVMYRTDTKNIAADRIKSKHGISGSLEGNIEGGIDLQSYNELRRQMAAFADLAEMDETFKKKSLGSKLAEYGKYSFVQTQYTEDTLFGTIMVTETTGVNPHTNEEVSKYSFSLNGQYNTDLTNAAQLLSAEALVGYNFANSLISDYTKTRKLFKDSDKDKERGKKLEDKDKDKDKT